MHNDAAHGERKKPIPLSSQSSHPPLSSPSPSFGGHVTTKILPRFVALQKYRPSARTYRLQTGTQHTTVIIVCPTTLERGKGSRHRIKSQGGIGSLKRGRGPCSPRQVARCAEADWKRTVQSNARQLRRRTRKVHRRTLFLENRKDFPCSSSQTYILEVQHDFPDQCPFLRKKFEFYGGRQRSRSYR